MTWFEQTFGFREQEYGLTQRRCRMQGERLLIDTDPPRTFQVGRLELPSLGELRQRVSGLAEFPSPLLAPITTRDCSDDATEGVDQGIMPDFRAGSPGLAVCNILADAHALHTRPEVHGALIQVASQFNLLEMPGPSVTPEDGITAYAHDHTQGPACALACAPATLFRNYLVRVDANSDVIGQTRLHQINALRDLEQALGLPGLRMQNGYAMADAPWVRSAAQRLQSMGETELDGLRQCLRIGWQQDTQVTATGAPAGQRVSQVFCSALPVAYNRASSFDWAPLACLVLQASYEATLLAAVLNAQATGNPRVYLTAVGGGAFGNQREWIVQAMRRALLTVRHWPLQVHIVNYQAIHPAFQALQDEWTPTPGC